MGKKQREHLTKLNANQKRENNRNWKGGKYKSKLTVGTDIYLEWKGKTKEDQEKQYTGYSINAGNVGYLRASVGMTNENAILRAIFQEKYWKYSKDPYDFKANLVQLMELVEEYISAAKTGKELSLGKKHKKQQEYILAFIRVLVKNPDEKVVFGEHLSDENTRRWINSLIEFFRLGIKLQNQGKEPYPEISW